MTVNGLVGGEPLLQKTVLPVSAEANVSIRLAPGQDPDEIAPVFERLLREAAPEGADVEVERWSSALPGLPRRIRPRSAGAGRVRASRGARPLLVRVGGSLPIVPALAEKGIPTVITGFDLPEGTSTRRTSAFASTTSRSQSRRARSFSGLRFASLKVSRLSPRS